MLIPFRLRARSHGEGKIVVCYSASLDKCIFCTSRKISYSRSVEYDPGSNFSYVKSTPNTHLKVKIGSQADRSRHSCGVLPSSLFFQFSARYVSKKRRCLSLFARSSVRSPVRSFVLSQLAVAAPGRKKRVVTAEKESDSTFPRFRRARRAGHSSILASRADGLSLPLPLWPSSLPLPLPRRGLSIFSVSLRTSSAPRPLPCPALLGTTTSINPDCADTFDRYRRYILPSLAH